MKRAAIVGAALIGWASLGALSCGRQHSDVGSNATVAERAAAPTRRLSEVSAFDLTVSADRGALLGWVESSGTLAAPKAAALKLVRLDAQGAAQPATSLTLVSGAVSDLVLADTSAGLSVIWREADGSATRARGAWLDAAGASHALELGAAWGDAQAGRGNLALVSRGSSALALVRGPRESCEDGSTEVCFGFHFYSLSAAGAIETGLGLRVPVPCDARAAQLLSPPASSASAGAEPRFHYAVCTSAARAPVLTVFSIEPDRSYASAHQVFSGCTPLGAGYFAGQPTFVADCPGARQLARVPGADAPLELRNLDVRGLLCGPRGARLRLGSEWLELDQPTDHLELLLDSSLSPPGARAVWTGAVLLVAQSRAGRLALDRYGCSGSELQQLQSPLD